MLLLGTHKRYHNQILMPLVCKLGFLTLEPMLHKSCRRNAENVLHACLTSFNVIFILSPKKLPAM